ncbi:Uncharacterized protein OBRU01_13945 [Operophtera brumata]|uniref:Uncharacterized protein n=1 Tax=Operophtera brumata TaxID=104452 RepID=A0A0L7L7I7_OPEBR|nr:Uncharacterized protein OBRU01_13945 [Operophtera brumata]
MDSISSTADMFVDLKTSQDSVLLGIIKELCSEDTLSSKLRGKKQIPQFIDELENLKQLKNNKKSHKEKIKELQESIDDKLNTIEEQEYEKVELMMQWLNHRVRDVTSFSEDSTELLTVKTRILELNEIHSDLRNSIREMEQQIKTFKDIIESDLN